MFEGLIAQPQRMMAREIRVGAGASADHGRADGFGQRDQRVIGGGIAAGLLRHDDRIFRSPHEGGDRLDVLRQGLRLGRGGGGAQVR
jgi:hypothetical protein